MPNFVQHGNSEERSIKLLNYFCTKIYWRL